MHDTALAQYANMTNMFPTGWAHYLYGGLLIGAGVSLMFVLLGRVVGMSTVFSSTWSFLTLGNLDMLWALAGMLVGAYVQGLWAKAANQQTA